MTTPNELIKQYRERIIILQKQIDSHPFHYMAGFRFNDSSNYTYRLQREQEIDDLKRRIKEEEDRNQLLSHNVLNKQLTDQGVKEIAEKPTVMDNYIRFMKDGTPVGQLTQALTPVAQGVGNFISSPFTPILLIVGGIIVVFFVLPMFKR